MADVTIKSYRKEREKEILDSLQKGLEKVGLIVERQAKINVSQSPPSHPQVQTGRLRSSITHVVGDGEVEIGSNVYYSKYLEFGTPNGRQPPYPFLFPAVEERRKEIIEALKDKNFTVE
jgi:HK97 gp10 family phage protein